MSESISSSINSSTPVVTYSLDDFNFTPREGESMDGFVALDTASDFSSGVPTVSGQSSEKKSLWQKVKSGVARVFGRDEDASAVPSSSQNSESKSTTETVTNKNLFQAGKVTLNLDRVWSDKIGQKVEHTTVAHCDKFVDYMISPNAVQSKIIDKQPNAISKKAASTLLLPSKLMYGIDWGYFHLFNGVGKVDEVVNRNGIFSAVSLVADAVTGSDDKALVSDKENQAQENSKDKPSRLSAVSKFGAQWALRSAEVYGLGWGLSYAAKKFTNKPVADLFNGLIHKDDQAKMATLNKLESLASPAKPIGLDLYRNKDVANPLRFNDLTAAQRRFLTTRGQNTFWLKKGGWALGGSVLMAASGLVSNISADGVNFLIPEEMQADWNPATKKAVKTTFDLGIIGAGAVMLGESYRKVYKYLPNVTPKNYNRAVGYVFGGGYLAQSWWAYNVAAQQRILPQKNPGTSPNAAYNPLNWDWSRTQTHTTTSSAVSIFMTSPIWAALSPLTLKLTDATKWFTGVDSSVLQLTPDEQAYVNQSKSGLGRWLKGARLAFSTKQAPVQLSEQDQSYVKTGLRGSVPENWLNKHLTAEDRAGLRTHLSQFNPSKYTLLDKWVRRPLHGAKARIMSSGLGQRLWTSEAMVALRGKLLKDKTHLGWMRRKYVAANIATSLPLGLAIGRASRMAQGYTDIKSLSGGSMMSVFTYPAFTGSQNASLAIKGQVTNIDAFVAGMYVINNNFALCTWADEGVYQSTIGMINDYEDSTDPQEKADLAAELLNNYLISYGDVDLNVVRQDGPGAEEMKRTEKYKIWTKLNDLFGVDPEEILAEVQARAA